MKKNQNISVISPVLKWMRLYPFHVILLPLFYILHNFLYLRGVLTVNDFIIGLCKLILYQLLFYILVYIRIRNHPKTALIITTGSLIFLFFGQIKDTLFQAPIVNIISSYKILLPLLLILFIFFLRVVSKKASVKTATLFLNLLFSTYLIIEFINLESSERNISLTNKIELTNVSDSIKQAHQPDIYYLVFDGYPSSSFQKEKLQIDYNFLDTNLITRNFYVAKEPVSLYNYTAFSIASTFNMNYLTWLEGIKRPKPEHFSKAVMQIKKSSLTGFLEKSGYEIKNYSFFSLSDKPSLTTKKLFYEVSPKIIFGNSLWNRVKWQLVPNIFPSFIYTLNAEQIKDRQKGINDYTSYDNTVLHSLQKNLKSGINGPQFIYAHFQMPHFPYLYDSTGKSYLLKDIYDESPKKREIMFQNYLSFANKKIIAIVDSILIKSKNPPVIIIQSDHGSREESLIASKADVFRNYSAFYFPDNDYSLLNEKINNINTFRILLNKYFGQNLKMLPDSTSYLRF